MAAVKRIVAHVAPQSGSAATVACSAMNSSRSRGARTGVYFPRASSGNSGTRLSRLIGQSRDQYVVGGTSVDLRCPSSIATGISGCYGSKGICKAIQALVVCFCLCSLGAERISAQNRIYGFGSITPVTFECRSILTGYLVPFCSLRFSPATIENSGGHFHNVNRPSGKVATSRNGPFRDTVRVRTNAYGQATIWFKTNSRTIGQSEAVVACTNLNICGYQTYRVGLSNLHRVYSSSKWVLVGGYTTGHGGNSFNHWMNPTAIAKLRTVVSRFLAMHPTQGKVALNDMSLSLGGVFDIRRNWSPPHFRHSSGAAVDVQARTVSTGYSIPASRVNDFLTLCRAAGAKRAALESPGTSNQHIHCDW